MSPPSWVSTLWFKRPEWRDINDYTRRLNDETLTSRARRSSEEAAPRDSTTIPRRLALERVLENKTCNPMSLHDFYLYLKYIEHSSENLEFYLWWTNYDANYPKDQRDTVISVRPPTKALTEDSTSYIDSSSTAEMMQNKETLSSIGEHISQLEPPCVRAAREGSAWTTLVSRWSPRRAPPQAHMRCTGDACRVKMNTTKLDEEELDEDEKGFDRDVEAHGSTTVPLPMFSKFTTHTTRENRAELDAAVATFLLQGSEKELNISHTLRQRVLRNVEMSSDPKHLKPVADHIFEVMKNCSHRNFVSMGLSTGTYETVCVANLIGVLDMIGGLLLVFLQAFYPYLGSHTRFNVLYAMPLWAMGVTLLLVGTQGMCFVMLTHAKRQALPWERFEDDASVKTTGGPVPSGPKGWYVKFKRFMSKTVAGDRKFKVEDKYLRRLQKMILLQCAVAGVLAACLIALVFIFLPIWKETR